MEQRDKELQQAMTYVLNRLNEKNTLLMFCDMSDNKKIVEQCKNVNYLKNMALRSMQIGNYRKSMVLMIAINKILSDFEIIEEEIKEKISAYILNDSRDVRESNPCRKTGK